MSRRLVQRVEALERTSNTSSDVETVCCVVDGDDSIPLAPSVTGHSLSAGKKRQLEERVQALERKAQGFQEVPTPFYEVHVGRGDAQDSHSNRIVRISMDGTTTCFRKLWVQYVDSEGNPREYCSWADGYYGGELMIEPGATQIKAWVDNVGIGLDTRVCAVNRRTGDDNDEQPWRRDANGVAQTEVFCIADGGASDVDLVIMVRGAIYHSWVYLVADVARDPTLPKPEYEYWPSTAIPRRPSPTVYHCFDAYQKDAATLDPSARFARALELYLTKMEGIIEDIEKLGASSKRVRQMLLMFKGVCTIGSIATLGCVLFPPGVALTAVVSSISFLCLGLTSLFDYVTRGDLHERLQNALHEHRKLLLGLHKAALAAGEESSVNVKKHCQTGVLDLNRVVEVLHAFNAVTTLSAKSTAVVAALQLGSSAATTDLKGIAVARLAASGAADSRSVPAMVNVCVTITQVCAGFSVVLNAGDLAYTLTHDHPLQAQIDDAAKAIRTHYGALRKKADE